MSTNDQAVSEYNVVALDLWWAAATPNQLRQIVLSVDNYDDMLATGWYQILKTAGVITHRDVPLTRSIDRNTMNWPDDLTDAINQLATRDGVRGTTR